MAIMPDIVDLLNILCIQPSRSIQNNTKVYIEDSRHMEFQIGQQDQKRWRLYGVPNNFY